MESEDYCCAAVGEHAKGSCEEDEMDISGCGQQCLDTKLFFEFSKHGGSCGGSSSLVIQRVREMLALDGCRKLGVTV